MESPCSAQDRSPPGSPAPSCVELSTEAILTPRSKVRALLAQIDDDSDHEPVARPKSILSGPEQPASQPNKPTASQKEDAGEESDVPMPRGRLAARLKGTITCDGTDSDDGSDAEGAYERLKQELQQKHTDQKEAEQPANGQLTRRLFSTKTRGAPAILSQATRNKAGTTSIPSQDHHDDLYEAADEESSKIKATTDAAPGSSSDLDSGTTPGANERVLALVARKRAEREAREAVEEAARQKRHERMQQSSDRFEEMIDEDIGADAEDAGSGKKLASQARPTRKASKKAIEEMNRETQRLSRNMQLAHAAITRKKIAKETLFAKFNFKQPASALKPAENINSSLPGTSGPTSDAEAEHQTPPSSPPASPEKSVQELVAPTVTQEEETPLESLPLQVTDGMPMEETDLDEELPSMEDLISTTALRPTANGKGKQRAEDPISPRPVMSQPKRRSTSNFRVKLPAAHYSVSHADSDSDLEITPANPMLARLDKVFSRLPRTDSTTATNSNLRLRALAHLTSPSKRDKRFTKSSVPLGQLTANLVAQARLQAARERAERIEELRARGVIIQSAEEREREQAYTEDLLEKARREVEELTRKEKDERKREGRDNDKEGKAIVGIDESDDESYVASGEDDGEEGDDDAEGDDEEEEILSGSEEDEEEDEEGGVELDNAHNLGLVDFQASEDEDNEEEVDEEGSGNNATGKESDSEVEGLPQAVRSRRSKIARVIIDEDDEDEPIAAGPQKRSSPSEPVSPMVINPFAKSANANPLGAAPMGLTQAFAATMEESQMDDNDDDIAAASVFSLPMPEPNLPVMNQREVVSRVDVPVSPTLVTQHTTQSPFMARATQISEMPEPTQDTGIILASPLANRFASMPPSTVDTFIINNPRAEPQQARNSKLQRGRKPGRVASDEDMDIDNVAPAAQPPKSNDAFTALKKAERRLHKLEEFNKNKSNAKEMVEEQAEESEDEYAGLGGASDDESDGELDEETRKMVNDEEIELNESHLAAFHANKERVSDEKAIEKLYKDINSGMLRRKRGGGTGTFDDLSDSDDEIERKRRIKRAEFARMRRALLADENVGKIAENPKKAAFLKAIEDRGDIADDDSAGFLDEPEQMQGLVREDSIQEVPNSQPDEGHEQQHAEHESEAPRVEKRKRPLAETHPNARLPPADRRTRADGTKKPMTLAEIRESVSFLVEEPQAAQLQVAATQSSDVSDDDEHEGQDENGSVNVAKYRFAARRRANPVVDRLSMKRAESSSATNVSVGRLAFLAKGTDVSAASRIPALLRKSTTGLSNGSEVTYATERTAGGRNDGGEFVRRGGTKKSSVAYFAREVERRRAVEKVEQRRANERRKAAEGRRGVLRSLGSGSFD